MTQDFFLGQLRLIIIAVISYAGGKGWLSSQDGTLIGALLPPLGLLLGPWLWSVYTNLNRKLVPSNSIAIAAENVANHATAVSSGTAIIKSDSDKGEVPIAKVVGAILVAFMLSAFAAPQAFAQVKLTGNPVKDFSLKPASNDGGTLLDKAFADFGGKVRTVTKEIVDKAIADVQSASDDAGKHNDNISKPCWDANLALLKGLPTQWENPPSDIGIALGIQIQRDLLNSITGNDVTSLKVACAALWGDQLKILGNVGLLLGIRIASGGLF